MSRPTILIVEDDRAAARALEVRLGGLGYVVAAVAPTAPEALRLAAQFRPGVVLVGGLPGGDPDRLATAAEIHRRYRVPAVGLTPRHPDPAPATEPLVDVLDPSSDVELAAAIDRAVHPHRAEWWLRAAIDETADAVIAADPRGAVTVFNPAAEALTGWGRAEAVGRNLREVLRLVHRADGRAVLPGSPIDNVLLLDRSGVGRPVEVTTTGVRDEDGRAAGTVSVIRPAADRTQRAVVALSSDVGRAAAQALTLRGMLQLCVDSVVRNLDAAFARIWTLNTAGNTLLLQAGAGLHTHPQGPHDRVPVGASEVGLVARERRPVFVADATNDPLFSDPGWARRERVGAFAGYPLLIDARLVGVLGVYSRRALPGGALAALASVASTIAVGVERKQLEEQLRQSQKMEAIGQLAGGVAHDFNNLLTIINGYSEIIQTQLPPSNPVSGLVAEIAQAGTRAASLTRQLLAFSRKAVVEPRVLDLNAVVGDLEKLLRRLIGEDVELATVPDPALGSVLVDPGQVEQVLMNLAINARDAMPRGGKLTIETANAELDVTCTQAVPDARPGPYVLLAVSDTGVGMDEAVMAHLFEPFFTTKSPGRGTGLGLATVYGIVKQSGGHVAVYSEVGHGTTFKIYLPRVADGPVATRSHFGATRAATGTETVLLAEDEGAVRALARHVLKMHGYAVLEAGHGREALRIADDHLGPIHLLVTDVVMPEMGGRQLADELAARRAGTRVLYLSGYTDDAIVRHGVLQAESAFLQKPFTPTALVQKVREVLDR
jgi:PAS domain S-box-containing protein